ncbi:unnamed protein product [Penicillium salamii]|uniref:Uncharacterized protein n=1 Tax=Penicillium salamii TaxID=1612424 RepID=A0A9W4NB55_9EURO|nr:unnamed protein product [Penicillium salamii]CAG8002939.1 unnamed protein product [Penicillium salamii]CAG8044913.1 unnamed protein product [Penicillium salamii]CAG8067091.1 unnamed protein product [Penicillium salamii]CAG8223348.1 unnamed protein product [Penicillium salamii]
MMRCALFILLFVSFVKADDDWDDFTNNLATDLAPLITLFGERLTKQFLSESISALDNVIFALSPLGVLTAVVSVIRICGSSSLRAFVGRAQEGPAEAEMELLPCVSESTAELFNDGGVARVFGRPKIVEIVSWEDDRNGEISTRIGTMKEALEEGAWSCRGKTAPSELPELDIPNLSLNKGIKQRGQGWFYCAAVLGGVLQSGTIIYAALTVFVFPQHFKKDDKAVASYAFPFYFLGTTLLFIGMFFCAFIMERSSKEFYLKPEKPSKIYWLQPGNQDVGDQAFNAFLAVKENPDEYIKSVRDRRFDRKYTEIYSTLASTLLGFILQFVGLRGLHASVILAQLGSTFLMAVIRTCLRTERMAPDENKMRDDRDLTSDKKQELDCFAFHLLNVESFDLVPLPDRSANISSPCLAPLGNHLAKQLIQTRVQLARLTSNSNQSMNVNWDNMPIRRVSRNLVKAIESTMDLLSDWGADFGTNFEFRLGFACEEIDTKSFAEPPGTYSIGLLRCGDVLRWKVDANELEAVLGLWVWSLVKSNEHWREPGTTFCRLVGLDENESSLEETYLYFHKWIFRQTEARLVSSDVIGKAQRLFISEPKDDFSEKTALAMRTSSSFEYLAAQDIFVQFLKEAMINVKELGGDVDVVPGIQGSFLGISTRINDLVSGYEDSALGSREDALLCIIPVLKKRGLLPDLSGDSPMVKARIAELIKHGKWRSAFALLRWLCERSVESELETSTYELGFLCRQAMLSESSAVRSEGADQTCRLLKSDIRDEFFEPRAKFLPQSWTKSQYRVAWWNAFCVQLGWVAWEITKEDPNMHSTRKLLEHLGIQQELFNISDPMHETEDLLTSRRVFKHWLTVDFPDFEAGLSSAEDGDDFCFRWAIENNHYALFYFLLRRVIELSPQLPDLVPTAYANGAKNRSHWAMQVLSRHEMDIDAVNSFNQSALVQCIAWADVEGVRMLLDYGANVNGGDSARGPKPLFAAIEFGRVDILELILQHGASPHAFDNRGLSAMWWASRSGDINIVDVLLRHGAPMDLIEYDETPLMFAVSEQQLDMLAFLIEKGADIDARDSKGHTALMCAALDAKFSVLELLIQKGADVHIQDGQGLTALDLARKEERNFTENLQYQHNMGFVDRDTATDWHIRSLRTIATLEKLHGR